MGFGEVSAESFVELRLDGVILYVLVANLPQAIVSFLYLFYNGLFTCMLLGKEWASLAQHKKPLRVSMPNGEQRSTYWLQLPYRYAVPIIAAMTTLHWLIAQSLFVVRVQLYDEGVVKHVETQLGYSCIGIISALLLGSIMLLACVASGFRRLYPGIPIAGCCSLAISAACHRPDDDTSAATVAVKWGAVTAEQSSEIGHCCITSKDVSPPLANRFYAGK